MKRQEQAGVAMHGTTAAHMKIIRANGTVEHRTSFSRPRPFYNLRGWRWLIARWLEYRRWEKADG